MALPGLTFCYYFLSMVLPVVSCCDTQGLGERVAEVGPLREMAHVQHAAVNHFW